MLSEQKQVFITLLAGFSLLGVIGAASSLIVPAFDELYTDLVFVALVAAVGGALIMTAKRADRAPTNSLRTVALLLLAAATWHLLKMVLVVLEELAQGLRNGLATVLIVRLLGSLLSFAVFFWLAARNRNRAETGV